MIKPISFKEFKRELRYPVTETEDNTNQIKLVINPLKNRKSYETSRGFKTINDGSRNQFN